MLRQQRVDREFIQDTVCRGCPKPAPIVYVHWMGHMHACTSTVYTLLNELALEGSRH